MTKPSIIFFGFDFEPHQTAKVFVRTLLFSTAHRGQVIEHMYVHLHHNGSKRTFSFWGHGETNKLSPGSGLYVSQAGVAANHHFVLSAHQDEYTFEAGDYLIEVFARIVGRRSSLLLATIQVPLSVTLARSLQQGEGIFFELDPDTKAYVGHSRKRFRDIDVSG